MLKLKVGILMGGMSLESEVSFNSGRTVYDHLDQALFERVPIFQKNTGELYLLPVKFIYRGKIADFESRLSSEAQQIGWQDLQHLIDFAYIAMHGRYAEDGSLQGMLQMLGIPYLGTKHFGSALSRDKFLMYDYLSNAGITVPKHLKISNLSQLNPEQVTYPCVVKPQMEGSSLGVAVVRDQADLLSSVKKAMSCFGSSDQAVLVEEKLSGSEFTAIVITDPDTLELIALPPTEIVIESNYDIFDYDQKYMPGRATKYTPARFSAEVIGQIQGIAKQIMSVLQIETFVRVDGFYTADGQIVMIDVNTISGMAPSSFLFRQAAEVGLDHSQLINALIKVELKKYQISF